MKHTPGPWIVMLSEDKPYAILPAGRHGTICQFSDVYMDQEANARLIAAAPDLLEACEEALPYCDGLIQEMVERAIAKVKGSEP